MHPSISLYQRLQSIVLGIIACIFLIIAFDTVLFPTWREGRMAIQVVYADGRPAAGLGVIVKPVDIISYTPRSIRALWTMLGTGVDGTWQDFNSQHYGRYEVTLFSDTHFTRVIHKQRFNVLPFQLMTTVKIVLNEAVSSPKPSSPT